MTPRPPRLWVIGGPNGSGKSSIVGARIAGRFPIVNPDDIARDAADGTPASAGRVADGGHDVPEADVFRRYAASMSNLAAALDLAERAWVLDNSYEGRRLLLIRDAGRVRFLSAGMTTWALAAIPERLRGGD